MMPKPIAPCPAAQAMPHPVTIDAVLARWLDGEALDLTSELRKAAVAARGEMPGESHALTRWGFHADF